MHRNIYERVEVMFHVRDAALCKQILTEVVAPYLADTEKTRILLPNGEYVRTRDAGRLAHSKNGFRFNAQEFLIDFVEGREGLGAVPAAPRFLKIGAARDFGVASN
jgi:polyphosphate kinase